VKEQDGDIDGIKEGVLEERHAEVGPRSPGGAGGVATAGGDAQGSIFLDKAEFICESQSLVRWTSFQKGCAGKVCCNAPKNSSSVR
jgi:hypothetical protein